MKQYKINGFNEKQIFQLYAYLVAYEEDGIEKYKSTKAMLEEHPELSKIDKIVKPVIRHHVKSEELTNINFKELHNEVYQTNNKGNLLLSFLAHLRNSIAHGDAVEYQENVLITDFEPLKYHPINFTARGCIEFDIITKITEILKKINL